MEEKWRKEKRKREKESLEKHARLSKQFKEDRLSYERERKGKVNELINSVYTHLTNN